MKRIAVTAVAAVLAVASFAPAAGAATGAGSGDVCNSKTVILFIPIC